MLRGAAALAAAGVAAKVGSAVYRVLVARWLGAEAIGLYEMAAPVLAAGISICGLGLPVAAAALIAAEFGRGRRGEALRLLRASRLLLLASGAVGAVAVAVMAPALAHLLGNRAAAGALRAVAPAIALAVLLAGEKSWLQASGRVAASAAVVAVEQFGRVAAGMAAALRFVSGGPPGPAVAPLAAGAVAWAPAAGAATGLAAAFAADRALPPAGRAGRALGQEDGAADSPVRRLLQGGGPNWISNVVSSLTAAVDAALVAWRLRVTGLGADAATAALGELNGMALPLATAPAVLFGALASALVPAVAADWARGDAAAARQRGATAYFWVLAVATPAAVGVWQLAQPLALVLYRNVHAAPPLGVLAWGAIPLGLSYVAAALANAVGRPSDLLPGVLLGAIVKSALVLILTDAHGLALRGAALGILCGLGSSTVLNVRAVSRQSGCAPPWRTWVAVVLPAAGAQWLCAVGVWALMPGGDTGPRVLGAMAGGGGAYALVFVAARRLWRWRETMG